MRLAPGSFAWLVAHDLTLSWRRFRGLFRSLSLASTFAIIVAAQIVFHLIALPAAGWFEVLEAKPDPTAYHLALAGGVLLVLSWMTAQGLTGATRALHARGDLDLLLASPVSPRNIVAARAVAIAMEATGSVAMLVAPVIDMNVLAGRTHWLAAYPVLAGAGMVGAAIGLAGAIVLFAAMGARRARLASQIAATLIGGGFMLAAQVVNLLPTQWRDNLLATLGPDRSGTGPGLAGVLWLPVRAATGDVASLLLWLAVTSLAFAFVAAALGERFAKAAVATAGTPAAAARRRRTHRTFRAGTGRALRRKEWLLLSRDPWLVSQVFLHIVYVLPIAVVLLNGGATAGSITLAAGPSIVVIAAQLSGAFAWLAISGEDAPDVLASAPITRGASDRGKIEAVAVPVGLIVALPLAWLAFLSPRAGAITLLFAGGAALSTACLNLWYPTPGKRGDLMRRHQQSRLVGLMEHLISLFFGLASALAIVGSLFALLPVALAMGVLWLNRRRPSRRPAAPTFAGEAPA